jgi:hypothetical protein
MRSVGMGSSGSGTDGSEVSGVGVSGSDGAGVDASVDGTVDVGATEGIVRWAANSSVARELQAPRAVSDSSINIEGIVDLVRFWFMPSRSRGDRFLTLFDS